MFEKKLFEVSLNVSGYMNESKIDTFINGIYLKKFSIKTDFQIWTINKLLVSVADFTKIILPYIKLDGPFKIIKIRPAS